MKKLVIAVALVGVVLLGVFLILRSAKPKPGTATFPDGTQLIVQAVTYGTNHVFVHGSEMLGKIQQYLPFTRRFLLPLMAMRTVTKDEFLIIWYSLYNPATEQYISLSHDQFDVVDEHGCAFRVQQFGGNQSTTGFSVSSAYVRVFPRRQKTFTFRAKFANRPPLDVQVTNPLYPITAEWTPEPLPATRKTNNLEVTLTKLKANRSYDYVTTEFDIYEEGVQRNEWYSPSRTFRDAGGNQHWQPLCRYERAWKVEVDLYKTAKAPFPEEAIWRLSDITVPESGQFLNLTNQINIAGLHLRPVAFCGAGKFAFSNDVCISSMPWKEGTQEDFSTRSSAQDVQLTFSSKAPSLLIRVDGWRTAQQLLIRAATTEAASKSFSRRGNADVVATTIHSSSADAVKAFIFRGSADNMCRYAMDDTKPGERIHLELIPQQGVRFEFLIEPPRP